LKVSRNAGRKAISKNKNPYLVPVAVVLTCGAVIVLIMLMLNYTQSAPSKPELDEDKLLAEAKKLVREGAAYFVEAQDLYKDNEQYTEESRALMEKGWSKFEEARDVLAGIYDYYDKHNLDPEGKEWFKAYRNLWLNMQDIRAHPSDW
jgi:hypothetical protein